MITMKKTIKGVVFIGLVLTLNACVVSGHHPDVYAESHLHGSLHGWYYYPDARVYFHITDRYYYYPYGTGWRRANHLPVGWVLNANARVRINIAGRPYLRHSHHRRQYPGRRPNHGRPGSHNDRDDHRNGRDDRHNHRHDRDNNHGNNHNHRDGHDNGRRPSHGDNHEHREGRHSSDRKEHGNPYLPHTKNGKKYKKEPRDWKDKAKQGKGKSKKDNGKGKSKAEYKGNGKGKEYRDNRRRDDDRENGNESNSERNWEQKKIRWSDRFR